MASVSRRSNSARADRRDDLRRRLLIVVERLLEQGEAFGEVSVERLVTEADISRSTFYLYFEDKGDLLAAWFSGVTAELEAAAAGWWGLGEGLARTDLRSALERIVVAYQPHTTLMAALYDIATYDQSVRGLVDRMMNSNIAGLRKHIRTGQKRGFVNPDLLPEQTAAWLTWMAERGLHRLVRGASPAEVSRLTDAYTDIIWNVLYAGARTGALRRE